MKKRIFPLLLVFIICICAAIPVFATEGKTPCLLDYADLLTTQEENALEERLENIAQTFSVEVAIVTMPTCQGKDHGRYAKSIYQEYGYGLGEDKDGILLLIDMDEENRGWYIYGKALGADAMTNSVIDTVGEDMTPDLRDGDYAAAFDTFADACQERIDIAINGEPFNVTLALVASLIIGIVLSLIVTGIMIGQLKSVRAQYCATDYVRPGSMNVTQAHELFLYRTVQRSAKPKSSSSSRSGSRESGGGGSF